MPCRCDVKPEALMHMKTTTEAGLRAISAATMQRLEALSEQLQDLEIEVGRS